MDTAAPPRLAPPTSGGDGGPAYLRHNLSQPLLAELFGCSQPTISRLITLLIPILTEVLTPITEATAERELRSTVRVDGFLVPIGDRRKRHLHLGHVLRQTPPLRIQRSSRRVLARPPGHDRPSAARCDARRPRLEGIRLGRPVHRTMHADGGPGGFADTAYTGTGLTVPKRRTGHEPLSVHIREVNKAIASRRACVERVIAHLRNWKIFATGYRRLLANFPATLAAVTALEIYRTSTRAS